MHAPRALTLGIVSVAAAIAIGAAMAPSVGADAILRPHRRPVSRLVPDGCLEAAFAGAGVELRGWRCPPAARPRGVIVFLHGVADNREGAHGIASRFAARGYEVVAYDSRGHGDSQGSACTYGFHERVDLSRVLDVLVPLPVAVIGTSLGGAVALQTAADDTRIRAIVAAETFADLRSVARERAWFLPSRVVDRALDVAQARGHFSVDSVSPAEAAKRIHVPVLLVHGARDVDTRPAHSQQIYVNLRGPKRLLLIEEARHNQALSSGWVWDEIGRWIDDALPAEGVDRR